MALLTGSFGDFLRSLASSQPYKPGQGDKARKGTLAVAAILIGGGVYSWSQTVAGGSGMMRYGIPAFVGVISLWVAYRLVNFPRFADFLITTEAEMNKVSWPSRTELKASTLVVIIQVTFMGVFLFVADTFWRTLLYFLGVSKISGMFGGGGSSMLPSLPVPWMSEFWHIFFN